MNELVIMHNKQAVTSSNRVANVFGKEHRNVLATIGGLLKNQQAHTLKYQIGTSGKSSEMAVIN